MTDQVNQVTLHVQGGNEISYEINSDLLGQIEFDPKEKTTVPQPVINHTWRRVSETKRLGEPLHLSSLFPEQLPASFSTHADITSFEKTPSQKNEKDRKTQ